MLQSARSAIWKVMCVLFGMPKKDRARICVKLSKTSRKKEITRAGSDASATICEKKRRKFLKKRHANKRRFVI